MHSVNSYENIPDGADSVDVPRDFASLAAQLIPKTAWSNGVLNTANGGTGRNNGTIAKADTSDWADNTHYADVAEHPNQANAADGKIYVDDGAGSGRHNFSHTGIITGTITSPAQNAGGTVRLGTRTVADGWVGILVDVHATQGNTDLNGFILNGRINSTNGEYEVDWHRVGTALTGAVTVTARWIEVWGGALGT